MIVRTVVRMVSGWGRVLPHAALLLVTLFAGGCASRKYQPLDSIPPQYQHDEIQAELTKFPSDFVLQIPDSTYAWERAQLFFVEHTSGREFAATERSSVTLSNSGKDPIRYQVRRIDLPGSNRFTVTCAANSSAPAKAQEMAPLACKNLARFIRDGVLEGSFLYQ